MFRSQAEPQKVERIGRMEVSTSILKQEVNHLCRLISVNCRAAPAHIRENS